MIRVVPIQTGTAQLKRAQQCGKEGRSALQRKIDIFRDTQWVGPIPIFAFLIEHPEGLFLVRHRRYGKELRSRLSTAMESLLHEGGHYQSGSPRRDRPAPPGNEPRSRQGYQGG